MFHQDIHRLILVFGIVEPVHCAAIRPDIAQQYLAILCGPVGVGGPDRERKILQIGFNVAVDGVLGVAKRR